MRKLYLSLKYRPKILKLILKLRQCIKKKSDLIIKLKQRLKETSGKKKIDHKNKCMQTDSDTKIKEGGNLHTKNKNIALNGENTENKEASENKLTDWKISNDNDNEGVPSLADQVKEVAQNALQQSGMVYVESAGMYYDYKTGYYYSTELGLYYHTDTGCYYTYSDEKKSFVFHSYPDRSNEADNAALKEHERRKAKKHKRDWKKEDDIDKLTKNLSQGNEENEKSKKYKSKRRKISKKSIKDADKDESQNNTSCENDDEKKTGDISADKNNDEDGSIIGSDGTSKIELEDGECSDSSSDESADDDTSSNASTSATSDDDSVARHHPPCMRVVVRETGVARLRAGSLFLVTKDGGVVGREGANHAILLKDHNVSRNHLQIKYDLARRTYVATDLGSKNGTILNGARMSESQVVSKELEIVHGSILEIGETKLLCHIHPGTDTCGHCEPGLIMETEDKEKKLAYTRTCSVHKQHQLELARLRSKYAPQPLAIEATAYNDRAQTRRQKVGSTHHAEKTQASDLETYIAPENKGFKLLEKMGWSKGEGLGKDSQGDTEPIPMVSNDGKSGLGTGGAAAGPPPAPAPLIRNKLGHATLRLASNTKMLKPPAKAFQDDDEDDDEEPLE